MNFVEKYSEILEILKPEIERVKQEILTDIDLVEPLKSRIFDILKSPSKCIRPLVSFLYLKSGGFEITDEQILYQSAIEIVHNASLIHDDVIDESSERRKVKTLNSFFSGKIAVISGDYLLAIGLNKVLRLNMPDLVYMFCETMKSMAQGETEQYFGRFKIPSLDEYIQKSRLKTAKLFETAILGSSMLVGQNCGNDFAMNFGIAFQIRDDLINCKTTKSDINEGIYTAPVIFSGGTYISDEGIEKAECLLNNYIESAVKSLDCFQDSLYKSALISLTEILKYE